MSDDELELLELDWLLWLDELLELELDCELTDVSPDDSENEEEDEWPSELLLEL